MKAQSISAETSSFAIEMAAIDRVGKGVSVNDSAKLAREASKGWLWFWIIHHGSVNKSIGVDVR